MSRSRRVALAWGIVALQGVLLLGVVAGAIATEVGPRLPSSLAVGLSLVVLGVVVFLWAVCNLGTALTPLPMPNGAGLAAHGAYRFMRHPIYTGALLACVGVAIGAGTVLAYVAVFALVSLFEVKTRLEETWLVETYDGYAAYAASTGKFVPGLGRRSI